MSVNEITDFIFGNCYERVGFSKENSYYSMKSFKKKDLLFLGNKLIAKILDPRNAKEHYQSFIKKKNTKSVNQSEVITYQLKTFEKPNFVDIKSVITEHPIISHKLSKTIRQGKNVGSYIPLYSDTKKSENFLNEKNVKRTK